MSFFFFFAVLIYYVLVPVTTTRDCEFLCASSTKGIYFSFYFSILKFIAQVYLGLLILR